MNRTVFHGWVEYQENGQGYVIDAELPTEKRLSQYNFFMVPYPKTVVAYFDENRQPLG
ncbi:MAG: hypothetical protein IJ125_07130 [Atopobiaceae bacterium]|nr:hypothetical protein [Atopobiaceae bacterium]